MSQAGACQQHRPQHPCAAWQREGPSAEEVQTLLTLEQRTYESQLEENTFWQELIAGCYQGRSWQKVRDPSPDSGVSMVAIGAHYISGGSV